MRRNFPPLPPEARADFADRQRFIVRHMPDEVKAIALRLKKLKTDALQRSLSWRKVSDEYAQNCEMCHGTGQYHFCPNPYCTTENELETEDCVHFTPDELEQLDEIHLDYLRLINKACEMAMENPAGECPAPTGKTWN